MYKNRRYNAQTKDESEANEMKRTAAFADGSEGIVASVLESEELKYGDFSSLEAALNVAKNIPDCTVKLLNDTEFDDDILIDSGEFTIDWNGCTVGSADISFAGTAKITMTDSNRLC